MAKKTITIYDIAAEAGVSPATVSRVLSGRAGATTKKQEIVRKLIQKYNFQPNALARGLSDNKTKIIGIIAADIRNLYYGTLVVECEIAAHKRGYTVMLCNVLDDKEVEHQYLEKFYQQRVDAIIQLGCRVDDLQSDGDYVAHVNRIGATIPFVITGNLKGANCRRLNIDDREAMRLAMEHLTANGHQNIAFVGGRVNVTSTYEKWQQYIYLLGRHSLPFRPEYTQEGNYSEPTGYACMQKLLEAPVRPTAVIAVNDYTALGVYRAASEHGLSVPDDISLVSFDNTMLAELMQPKLTSVDYNYPLYGERLVDMAIKAIEGEEQESRQQIVPKLVVRQSVKRLTGG
jgi:LacI family transcriptional regulator